MGWAPPRHRDPGWASDSPRGRRKATTLRNEPVTRPMRPARAAANGVLTAMALPGVARVGHAGDRSVAVPGDGEDVSGVGVRDADLVGGLREIGDREVRVVERGLDRPQRG